MAEDTLSVKEVAALLGLNASTVRRKRERGELIAHEVHTRHGPAWRFPRHLLPAPPARTVDAPPAELVAAPVGAPVGDLAPLPHEAGAIDRGAQGVPGELLLERHEALLVAYGRQAEELRQARARLAELDRPPWWRRLLRLPS